VTGLLVAAVAAYGTYLLVTRFVFGWRTLRRPRHERATGSRRAPGDWLAQAGLVDVRWSEVLLVCAVLAAAGFVVVFAVFGGIVPAALVALATGSAPLFASRSARTRRIVLAQEAWPRIIEEVRVLTGSTGMSIPQALFRVGGRTPVELRDAFGAAHREWQLTTDFSRAIAVLKAGLADPTADAACETLLTAHEIGGVDLERRLVDLAEDRMADVQGRKDARAKQAGARFARVFVLVAPAGMALVGLGIGDGRAAYGTATGQLLVVAGILVTMACWVWAGRIMALPTERRVFSG
jgi:tight adherence protein B